MYQILWRRDSFDYVLGLSIFVSEDYAQKQIDIWRHYFPENEYMIVPLVE